MVREWVKELMLLARFEYDNDDDFLVSLDESKIYNSEKKKGSRGVMVIVVGNGHGDTSSNPGRDLFHFTLH